MKSLLFGAFLALTACLTPAQLSAPSHRQRMASFVDRTIKIDVDCPLTEGWGSGVRLGPAHAGGTIIATAAHVAKDGCTWTWRGIPLIRVAKDEDKDIALLVLLRAPLPPLEESNPYLGMPIVTVGYPMQVFNREAALQVSPGWLVAYVGDKYRVTSPTYFGNSGGPVFDERGCLVGLFVSASTYGGQPIDGSYYVTPADRVFEMYRALFPHPPGYPQK